MYYCPNIFCPVSDISTSAKNYIALSSNQQQEYQENTEFMRSV
jgi:hypothetical protein